MLSFYEYICICIYSYIHIHTHIYYTYTHTNKSASQLCHLCRYVCACSWICIWVSVCYKGCGGQQTTLSVGSLLASIWESLKIWRICLSASQLIITLLRLQTQTIASAFTWSIEIWAQFLWIAGQALCALSYLSNSQPSHTYCTNPQIHSALLEIRGQPKGVSSIFLPLGPSMQT